MSQLVCDRPMPAALELPPPEGGRVGEGGSAGGVAIALRPAASTGALSPQDDGRSPPLRR
jgi:hypothetical protein